MIDIHSHIIFGVDDGPKSLDDSIALIKEAYRQGVRKIVATSHRRKGMFETPEEIILANFQKVKAEIEALLPEMTLLYGGELYFTSDILEKLEHKKIPTMNGTRFALIEFSSATSWKAIHEALSSVLSLGITPIVAHIERYNALEYNKERVQEIINMGCYTQINSAHIPKPKLFGDSLKVYKKRATYFLEEDLVHIVASDMHNLTARPPYMKEAYDIVDKRYGHERANDLFIGHQESLLANQFI